MRFIILARRISLPSFLEKGWSVLRLSKKSLIMLCGSLLAGCGHYAQSSKSCSTYEEFIQMKERTIQSAADLTVLFPKSEEEVRSYSQWAIDQAEEALPAFFNQESDTRTFDSTVLLFDSITSSFSKIVTMFEAYELVSPDDVVRQASHEEQARLRKKYFDLFECKEVYHAFLEYVNGPSELENLTSEEKYLLEEYMKEFKRSGFHLDDDTFAQAQAVKKEIAELCLQFEATIAKDDSFISVHEDELSGLDSEFISTLPRLEDGRLRLGVDYPTYHAVMKHCSNAGVRKALREKFNNRAFPDNYDTLGQIINKRDHLAALLGYESFAHLDLDDTMAKSVERVQSFLEDLLKKAFIKEEKEFKILTEKLPESVVLTDEGQMYSWDVAYVTEDYKKQHYKLDDREVAEYFPADRVIQGVFDLYQQFLGLSFKLVEPDWKWHEDVLLIEVHEKDSDVLRGYVYLDLYPRKNKYSHACHAGFIPTVWELDEKTGEKRPTPSVAVVIANFPKATADKPALLKFSDAETFLHEFGHAMHFLLGTTMASSTSGTNVKLDFVEMPSQMFEEWMYEPSVLRSMSGHYKTGEPLPENLIEKLIALKTFDSGFFVVRQCALAALSLELFKQGSYKNIDEIVARIFKTCMKNIHFDEGNHMAASFGHLGGYSARYYCYLWSKVFALDMFAHIKKIGTLDASVGQDLVAKVLSQGGSVDPDYLIEDFLGRPPTMDAFFNDMGIDN